MDQTDKNDTHEECNDDNDYLFADEIMALINEESNQSINDNQLVTEDNNAAKRGTGLQLIDDNIDLFGATNEENEDQLNGEKTHPLFIELFGDGNGISDDEYEDDKQVLSKQGKEIETNLSKSKSSNENSQSLFVKTLNNTKKSGNNSKSNANNTKAVNDELFRDFFSGIRIINPQISSADMKKRMESRKMVKMSLIKSHICHKSNDIEGDWVTIGVIVEKLAKTSKNGNSFAIWKLSDLKTDKVVTFFLFGTVYAEFWKLSVGTVIGLLNAKIMPQTNKDAKYAKKEEICALSIDHIGKLMIMGTAKDLSFCKAVKNNGQVCNALINSMECQYCVYHTRTAYKKFSSARAEIQNTFTNIEPNKAAMSSAKRYNDGNSVNVVVVDGMVSGNISLKKAKENEQKSLTKVVNQPYSIAGKNLAEYVNKTKNSNKIDAPVKSATTAQSVFEMFRAKNKQLFESDEIYPSFARGCRRGDMISLSSVKPKVDPKLKAINILKGKQLIREDPNQVKKRPKSSVIDKIDAKVTEQLNKSNQEKGDENKSKKVKRDLIDAIINRQSTHKNEVKSAENEAQKKYFTQLEFKEKLETKLLDTKEIECSVVTCKQCKYTAHTASDLCKQKCHRLTRHKALKRFFRCKKCKNRCFSFKIYPDVSCSKCGENSYEKTSISNIKTITSLKDEKLVISNENEPKFLNSLK